MFAAALLAEDADLLDARFWVATGLFVVALLLAAFVVSLVKKYWEKPEEALPSDRDQLSHFRALYEKGEISEEEYNQLRGVLGGGTREQLGLKKPKAHPPEPPSDGPGLAPKPSEPSL